MIGDKKRRMGAWHGRVGLVSLGPRKLTVDVGLNRVGCWLEEPDVVSHW